MVYPLFLLILEPFDFVNPSFNVFEEIVNEHLLFVGRVRVVNVTVGRPFENFPRRQLTGGKNENSEPPVLQSLKQRNMNAFIAAAPSPITLKVNGKCIECVL